MTRNDILRSCFAALLLLSSPWSASGQETEMSYGVPLYPDARPLPEVARAVEAYYRPAVPPGFVIEAGVFETPAAFEDVYHFYGPRMAAGKWGWRRKSYDLAHQTQTLRFMRASLSDDGPAGSMGEEDGAGPAPILDELEPLFGDPDLTSEEFSERLGRLRAEYPAAEIEIAEGTREVFGDTAGAQVRITIERPYVDLRRMEVVDRTRILFVKVWPSGGTSGGREEVGQGARDGS